MTKTSFRRLMLQLFATTALVAAVPAAAQNDQRAADAFFASRYTYCDAKLVSGFWRMDIYRAKVEIGMKLLNGLSRNIPYVLSQARRSGNRCGWEDTGYSYPDAQRLAQVWGLRDPYQAKQKAAMWHTAGRGRMVDGLLGR